MSTLVGVLLLWLLADQAMAATCDSPSKLKTLPAARQWNGWGATYFNDRFQRQPKLKAADVPRLQRPKSMLAESICQSHLVR
jgi:hypothetical protein